MSKFWITMGQVHVHSINGCTIDKDCAVEIEAEHFVAANERAHELFGPKFAFVYSERPPERYIPRGVIEL